MGQPSLRQLVRPVPRTIPASDATHLRLKDLQDAFQGKAAAAPDPRAAMFAEKAGREHLEDARNYGSDFAPRQVARDAAMDLGTGRAARVANQAMWRAMIEDSPRTSKLNNSATATAPTVLFDGGVSSRIAEGDDAMGGAAKVAVTKVTPWRMADGITGNPAYSDELMTRLAERNFPAGMDKPAVYHLDDLEKNLNRPFLVFRGLGRGFDDSATKGFMDPVARQIYSNASTDPSVWSGGRGFNVFQHEGIHSILDGINPSVDFLKMQLTRPAIGDRTYQLPPGMGRYLGSNAGELGNAIWHGKRLTEITHPGMRDVGALRADSDNWLDYVRHFEPGESDPIINLPGHRQEGQPAHGYNDLMEAIQQNLDAMGDDGLNDAGEMTHKLGQTDALRKALLA